jgi:PAS domain-containing protein
MAQNLESILARSLAAHLDVPAFLADPEGRIVYFNEAAELLVGRAFEDTPELSSEDLRELIDPRDAGGERVSESVMPLSRALTSKMPSTMSATSADGTMHYLATALPLLDRDGGTIGALLFWYEEKL